MTNVKGFHKGSAASEALYRKINWRLLPILMLCYFFSNLDRQNISFAKLQMQNDLAFSDAIYGLGAGIFFISYALFEVPSNLILARIGARRTISRILVLWGLTSAGMMFVNSVPMFYCLRLLLGVFEAGLFPGMVFYLTFWYGEARMARAISLILIAGPISGVLGSPLSGWLMTAFDGVLSLAGWKWMFLIEALPCLPLALVVWKMLADQPEHAKWLSTDEVKLLKNQTHITHAVKHHSFRSVLSDPRIYLMATAYFCLICGICTINFWLPSIIKASGVSSTLEIGFYTAIPYIASICGMIYFGRSSDRHRERRWHSVLPAVGAGLCLCISTSISGNVLASLTTITLATLLMYASYTVFWTIPSRYLKGNGAAGGIALINTIGASGGFVSPTIIGWATTTTGSLHAGLYVMVALLFLGASLLLCIRISKSDETSAEACANTTLPATQA
ncbi:MFS transporter [Pseudomonas putida]|uniref:MFS transporter n=1 Tax=Pseudomonas putida TaxID=303 RepID=UPI000281F798|nr:MFS transporter [Pseudomonas putida]EMR47543.1 putative transporter-like membrane protein [Pseudomonas putida LS46]